MAQFQVLALLPELGQETEQTPRHTGQRALAGSAIPLCQFILLCLPYNLGLNFDELPQLGDVNVAPPQKGRRVWPS